MNTTTTATSASLPLRFAAAPALKAPRLESLKRQVGLDVL